jgi:hypothetical protein
VLVAAAADGADDAAVAEDEHLRADALRRGAVRRHDRHERGFFAAREGFSQRGKDFVVHKTVFVAGSGSGQDLLARDGARTRLRLGAREECLVGQPRANGVAILPVSRSISTKVTPSGASKVDRRGRRRRSS